jgi:hypothetical protein
MFFCKRGKLLSCQLFNSFVNLLELYFKAFVMLVNKVGLFMPNCNTQQRFSLHIYNKISVCLNVQSYEIIQIALSFFKIKVYFIIVVKKML